MKKIKYLLFILLFMPTLVLAKEDIINKIDIAITIDNNGNAHVEEIWDVKANMGTEFYKVMNNLGNMEIKNFKVYEKNREFTYLNNWDIDASLSSKAYKNGINETSNGIELCWGKGSMGYHTFKITYDISNFVFLTSDNQVIYYKALDLDNMPDDFTLKLTGPSLFSDDLPVWGYGYKGYAYVKDGIIYMSNEENTKLNDDDYVVLLVKFPSNYFNVLSSNTYEQYDDFSKILDQAEKNTFEYNYNKISFFQIIGMIFSLIMPWLIIILVFILILKSTRKYKFGPLGKKINMKEINNFRDIPCNKDIFDAFFLAQAYNLNKKNTDFLGSLFLRWLFEDKIEVEKITKDKFIGKKEETVIKLKKDLTFTNSVESEMYDILIKASKDYVLESKELEKWSKNNYQKLFKWFEKAENYGRDLYVDRNLVEKVKFCHLIKDEVKEEAIKLAGLKKYLQEFSRIKEKEAIEVKLWKEYLEFAQIFGIADKVAEQFKNLYPEILTEVNNFDMSDVILINHISNVSVASATSARSAAQSYSAGGGGFSSGGGGGGSFGGGGGGGR